MRAIAFSLLCVSALFAQTPPAATPRQNPATQDRPGQPVQPGPPPPITPRTTAADPSASSRFSVDNLDRSTDPCVDFYQFACGGWMARNPIPSDQSRWGSFDALAERNREVLRDVLEEAAKPAAGRDTNTRLIGDYYAACMDEKAIDAKGLAPLRAELEGIQNLKDKAQLAEFVVRMHRSGMPALFEFGSGQDFKNSSEVIAQADQGGLGLPDRDYYLNTDQRSVDLRAKYLEHVRRMLELAGAKPDQAKAGADIVMRIETALAKASLDLVSRRDPEKVYHPMTPEELQKLAPTFRWNAYIQGSGAPSFRSINVAWPDFFKALDAQIQSTPLEDWKTYLRWHVIHAQAPLLPSAFVNENFDFFSRTLRGTKELRPRWKRCVDYTDLQLGEALGQKFVERTFGAEGKERTLKMVHALEQALGQDIQALSWMTPATKQKAQEKLKSITNKIGYPDKWRDYSSIAIRRDDAMGNGIRADQFEFKRQLDKIGKPVDPTEWLMSPPTVNAYYNPLENNINFPAGILQPPFYHNNLDDAVNYGGIGMVIGHELTHGFDDEGRQFDAKGNLNDWWTPADAKEFESRAACFVDQYSKFAVAPGANVNGKLTLGENAADNGGARVALMALMNVMGEAKRDQKIDGFTPEQRFFISLGQIWCQNITEQASRLQVQTDPHSPAKFRVNGTVINMPEFQKAFSCKAGQPMVSQNACRVW